MSYNIQIFHVMMTLIYVKLIIDVMESYVCDTPSLCSAFMHNPIINDTSLSSLS